MHKLKYKYFDRELSWLNFNARVLQEAADESNPLIERLKFLGIYSNNQDEFFRVRVATLRRLIDLHQKKFSEKTNQFQESMDKIMEEIKVQQGHFSKIFTKLYKELRNENILLVNEKELTPEQGEYVRNYFREKVRYHLFPIMLKRFNAEDSLTDQSIYLAIMLGRKGYPEKEAHAIIEIPTNAVNRFLLLPEEDGKKYIIILDDVIRYCLDEIFTRFKFDTYSAYTFKFTRDAELDIDNDVSKSFLELMTDSLRQRKKGNTLRFVHDRRMPPALVKAVTYKFKITNHDQVVEGGPYHNFKDFMKFPSLGRPDLLAPKVKPLAHKDIPEGASIIKSIRKKDIMLHYPYQPFQYVVDLLREASIDIKVRAIKMTIYRLANPSNVINALINAARNGKVVTVYMELQARFDEEANIYWSEKLQASGVKVMHSIPGLKVHSKLILIQRRENGGDKLYANIGTGNFHEKTGSLYCDETLLTADPRITSEVDKVFGLFQMSFRPSRFNHLIVSPFSTRNHYMRLLNREIKNATMGHEAWAIIKLNSLSDIQLIKKLYQASQAGVKIELIIRGICKLVPGVKGLSENIRVTSILDRYLEHARIQIFCNDGNELYYISSADWMVRNLDNRIEVTTPIYDPEIQKELKEILQIQLKDNCKARLLDTKMQNKYQKNDKKQVRTQIATYDYLQSIHEKSDKKK